MRKPIANRSNRAVYLDNSLVQLFKETHDESLSQYLERLMREDLLKPTIQYVQRHEFLDLKARFIKLCDHVNYRP